jgi:hypothetical protein
MIAILLFTLVTRTVGEIAPSLTEGAAGRLLVLDRRADETIAIRTRVPYFDSSRAELAVSRIAADGTATTSTIAPIPSTAGINGGDGAVTPNGYLVAWSDGSVHAAFIDSELHLQTSTTLPSYSSHPVASRNVVVRCTSRRCLVTWWEYDTYLYTLDFGRVVASLFDTSGNVLAARIELTGSVRQSFTVPFGAAASSSRFMVAAWAEPDYGPRQLRVISVDENGRAGFPVSLYETEDDDPTLVAIDSRGDEFVVVRALEGRFPAESVDAAGNVHEPWHDIASSPDGAIDALYLRCNGDVSLLALESSPQRIVVFGSYIAHSNLNVIRLDRNLRAFSYPPISVSDVYATNDSPKFLRTARGFVIGWNHGSANYSAAYILTAPRFAEFPADGPAPESRESRGDGRSIRRDSSRARGAHQYAVCHRVAHQPRGSNAINAARLRQGVQRVDGVGRYQRADRVVRRRLLRFQDSVAETRRLPRPGVRAPAEPARRADLDWP